MTTTAASSSRKSAGCREHSRDWRDPINPGNNLTGCVLHAGDNEYGSLIITRVNEQ